MTPLAWHLVLRLEDDRVLAPSDVARRRWARVLAGLAEVYPLLAWRVVDTHLHVLGLDTDVTELVRRLRIMIARIYPGISLLLTRRIPVRNQWHLAETFGYVLRQDEHHGVGNDPFQEGSAVLDILGMRVLGAGIALRVREHLPRVRRDDLLRHLGVTTLEESLSVDQLGEATCAAFALPDLAANVAAAVGARIAAAHAAREESPARVAAALGVTDRAVRRIWQREAPAVAVRAVRLQMGLRTEVAQTMGSERLRSGFPADSGPKWAGGAGLGDLGLNSAPIPDRGRGDTGV